MVATKFPKVHLIANKENVGFARANNQALKMAQGEYVLLLNPDTIIQLAMQLKEERAEKERLAMMRLELEKIIKLQEAL